MYFEDLPSGTHTIQAVFHSQGGDRIVSEELEFTNNREKDDSRYGLGKTWNEDGTLIADRGTQYLWNFDDPMRLSLESVSATSSGNIQSSINGIGTNACSLYYDVWEDISFYNSEWTVEYWAKDLYTGTDNISVQLRNVFHSNNYHSSANSTSYLNGGYYYSMNGGNDLTQDWMDGAWSSRSDRSEWHHYAIVSTGDRFELYMDGVLTNYTKGFKASSRTAEGLYIYMNNSSYIDELRISDIARSGDELWDYVQYVKNNNLLPE